MLDEFLCAEKSNSFESERRIQCDDGSGTDSEKESDEDLYVRGSIVP